MLHMLPQYTTTHPRISPPLACIFGISRLYFTFHLCILCLYLTVSLILGVVCSIPLYLYLCYPCLWVSSSLLQP